MQTHYSLSEKQVAFYIARFGTASSISLYDPSSFFFTAQGIEGCIGYKNCSGYFVVIGDPLCRQEDKIELALRFKEFSKKMQAPYIFLTATEAFAKGAIASKAAKAILAVASELLLLLDSDPKMGSSGRRLRGKVNQAKRSAVQIEEHIPGDPDKEQEMQRVSSTWLKERKGPQIHLLDVDIFAERQYRRWFIAKHADRIVSIAILQKLDAIEGWLLQQVLTLPSAPKGTSEYIIDFTLEKLKKENQKWLSLGHCLQEKLGSSVGIDPFSITAAKICYSIARKVFPLDSRKKFWLKFSPLAVPNFIVLGSRTISPRVIIALMQSLNAKV